MRLVKSRSFSFVLVSVQKEVIAMGRIGWIKKIMSIVLGSMLAAYGITLALYAGFGGATLAIVWQGMSKTFHISIGMASLIVALIMIVFVFFYDRSQLNIGTILYQLVYSFCVDLFADAHVYSSHLWLNAVIMILGVMLFAVGTGFYASASMGRGSYEALTFSLAEKNHWQVKGVRMILDVLIVIVGVVINRQYSGFWYGYTVYNCKNKKVISNITRGTLK